MNSATADEAEKLVREGATASAAITQKLQVTVLVQENSTAAHMQIVKNLSALQEEMKDVKRIEHSIVRSLDFIKYLSGWRH